MQAAALQSTQCLRSLWSFQHVFALALSRLSKLCLNHSKHETRCAGDPSREKYHGWIAGVGSRTMKVAPLYAGFAATGVGVALPGALLPALMERWHLGDAQSGLLFLMSFLGSSLGSLLVSGSLRLRLIIGSLAIAIAACALAVTTGFGVAALMGLYGAGLGTTMTSISLLRQQQAAETGIEMVRLNLLWATGALMGPFLAAHALRTGIIRPQLLVLTGCFIVLAGWAQVQDDVTLLPAASSLKRRSDSSPFLPSVPRGLILMVFLVTGIEAAAGSWLTTYTRRGGHSVADTIAAPGLLWAGLLTSRLLWSVKHGWISEAKVVRGSAGLMFLGALMLIASESEGVILLASLFLGLGIGPTYPLLLDWALHFERGGAIFFLAGLGSAFLPWLTGVISASRGSLRIGLVVPAVGCFVLLTLALLRPLAEWEQP